MLTRDGVIARLILAFCFFFLSGTEMVTGWPATCCGVAGTIELATAINRWSPLVEIVRYLIGKYRPEAVPAKTE
ncbi:MAG: hypothetical protein GX133_10420 [Syntrophomonadaceae bacterium]|nr:hypothetical protein [Syntrophomonadaceae bacterium]